MSSSSSANNAISVDLSRLSLDDKLTKRDLYGGAMTMSIPTKWRDVSDVRQVPDHQEVYQDCTFASDTNTAVPHSSTDNNSEPDTDANGNATNDSLEGTTGGCIIVEILERQNEVSDDEATNFFFHDLADANDDGSGKKSSLEYSNVWNVGKISPKDDSTTDGISSEEKCENNHSNSDNSSSSTNIIPNLSVRVKACSCIGIQTVGPMRNKDQIEEGKSSIVRIELCIVRLEAVQTDLLISLSLPLFLTENEKGKTTTSKKKEHSLLFKKILNSFEVVDWSLFG
jgi:hypothetical protein